MILRDAQKDNKALQRLLYVEDEKDIQLIAKLALTQVGGYDLCLCSSGEEALERAVGFSPDLILLDVMMPGMDGLQTFKALRDLEELKSVPVVFMTARARKQDLQVYVDLGALGVIEKPFNPMSLAEEVRRYWQVYLDLSKIEQKGDR